MSISYKKQGFKNGQVLKAEHLIKMEEGIQTPVDWTELTSKPFDSKITQEAETVTLTFDGNLEGREYVEVTDSSTGEIVQRFVKLTDRYIESSYIDDTVVLSDGTEDITLSVSDRIFVTGVNSSTVVVEGDFYMYPELTLLAVQDKLVVNDAEDSGYSYTLSAGMWTGAMSNSDSIYYIKSLTYHIPEIEEVNKLDPKFVPNVSDMAVNDETADGYVKNRTHYTVLNKNEGITWDGKTSGHVCARCYENGVETSFESNGITNFYHVSDIALSLDVLQKSTVTATEVNGETSTTNTVILADKWGDIYGSCMTMFVISKGGCFFSIDAGFAVAMTDNATMTFSGTNSDGTEYSNSVVFPKAGTYLFLDYNSSSRHMYISKIDTPWIGKKLDHNYVPNSDWDQRNEDGEGYIKNRTHYASPSFVIDWDGDTTGRECVEFPIDVADDTEVPEYEAVMCRVSDTTLTLDELLECKLVVRVSFEDTAIEEFSMDIGSEYAEDPEFLTISDDYILARGLIVAYVDNVTVTEESSDSSTLTITIPKKGIYFYSITVHEGDTTSYERVEELIGPEVVKQLDEKYMPDSVMNSVLAFGSTPATSELVTLTFDGDLTDKEYVEVTGGYYVKLTDYCPEPEQFIGGSFIMHSQNGDEDSGTLPEEIKDACIELGLYGNGYCFYIYTVCVRDGEATYFDTTFTKGLWVMYVPDSDSYVKSVSYYTLSEDVKQLDLKYIPEGVVKSTRFDAACKDILDSNRAVKSISEAFGTESVYILRDYSFTASPGYCATMHSDSEFLFELIVGETYKVVWNGLEYECVAKGEAGAGITRIEDSESNFAIRVITSLETGDINSIEFHPLKDTETTSHTVSITHENAVVQEEYIPVTIARTEDVDALIAELRAEIEALKAQITTT